MLNLYLLRHGKAANPERYNNDYDRPLHKKGIAQINQIGYMLYNQGVKPDKILSSAALRTKETAQIANHYLGIKDVLYLEELYLANQEKILESIQKNSNSQSILYSGHNFGISNLATYLADERYDMSTGMLIHFEFDLEDWNEIIQGSGRVIEAFPPNVYIP